MRALVTGGSGFLGKALALALAAAGHEVRTLARGDAQELAKKGIAHARGDVADGKSVSDAVQGCDVVFHVAAKAGYWGAYDDFHRANVTGTENVLAACRLHKVPKLVFTSSPSVVFAGVDQDGVDESAPYPRSFLTPYQSTKAEAERLVLRAHGQGLSTVALRPHLIWGPGDNHIVPRILARARAGRLRVVGDGRNLIDSIYIDNAVHAHILASERLSGDSLAGGRAYFITNGEPLPAEDLMNRILNAGGLPPVRKRIPAGAAYLAGALFELVWGIAGKVDEPLMTRFLARELSTSHWFDITAARQVLGYDPAVSIDEGMERLAAWLGEPQRERHLTS